MFLYRKDLKVQTRVADSNSPSRNSNSTQGLFDMYLAKTQTTDELLEGNKDT